MDSRRKFFQKLAGPFIAIPLPSSKDNHQFENALFYQQLGCNWILKQNEINNKNLTDKLINIIENKIVKFYRKRLFKASVTNLRSCVR